MPLNDYLRPVASSEHTFQNERDDELTLARIDAAMPAIRQYIAFFRAYPDLFVDFMKGEDSSFHFYFYQRVFLRAAARYKYTYCTFPRAYSKSFLSMLTLMIRCILYPGAHLFVTSGGKEQSAGIIQEKVTEICSLIPAFENELNMEKGQKGSKFQKDYVKITFKNGSWFDNIAARESSRGKRRHGGVMEECVGIDGDMLSQVIIPTMNISRNVNGERDPEEVINKSQLYITTAGYKNTFPCEKHTIIGACGGDTVRKHFVNAENCGVVVKTTANNETLLFNRATLCQAA